jgi:hypothetical protein
MRKMNNIRMGWAACLLAVAVPAVRAEVPQPLTPKEYTAQLAREEALLGYWPLAGAPSRSEGTLKLREAGPRKRVPHPGPLGKDLSLDLSNGRFLRILPTEELDAPEVSVELFCRIRQTMAGCLVGVRDGKATRFSLHITADSSTLAVWDGETVTLFEAPYDLEPGRWYHIALSISTTDAAVWVNGQPCIASGPARLNAGATGLPFVVGAVDAEEGVQERSDIAIAHLAIHGKPLTTESIQARLSALNWAERMKAHPREEPVASEDLDRRIARIEEEHGVKVLYKYSHEDFIPEIWHQAMRGTQIPLGQAEVMLTGIEQFLKVVPPPITREHLDSIYMFRTLQFGDHGMGGMAYNRGIYLCAGSAAHVRHAIFHEFSHILEVPFPLDREAWKAPLPPDFQYLGHRANENPYYHDDTMRSMGFLLQYSTMSLGEEVAVLSDYVFAREKETKELMRKFPAIRNRVALLIQRYKAIHPDYDFSAYDEVFNEAAADAAEEPNAEAGAGAAAA